MGKLAKAIKQEAKGEEVVAVAVYVEGGDEVDLLSFEEFAEMYDIDMNWEDCPRFYAWTKSRVIFLREYGSFEWVASVPREPTDKVVPQKA